MAVSPQIPAALNLNVEDLPWARQALGPAIDIKLLLADVEAATWAVLTRWVPNGAIPRHLHTGAVHAWTISGSWRYLEYPDAEPNVAGSYMFEPSGSTHTLQAGDEGAEIFFVIHGALVNYGEDGEVASVLDAAGARALYEGLVAQQGDPAPRFIVGGAAGFSG